MAPILQNSSDQYMRWPVYKIPIAFFLYKYRSRAGFWSKLNLDFGFFLLKRNKLSANLQSLNTYKTYIFFYFEKINCHYLSSLTVMDRLCCKILIQSINHLYNFQNFAVWGSVWSDSVGTEPLQMLLQG